MSTEQYERFSNRSTESLEAEAYRTMIIVRANKQKYDLLNEVIAERYRQPTQQNDAETQ